MGTFSFIGPFNQQALFSRIKQFQQTRQTGKSGVFVLDQEELVSLSFASFPPAHPDCHCLLPAGGHCRIFRPR